MRKEIVYISDNYDFSLAETRWILMNNFQYLLKTIKIKFTFHDFMKKLTENERELFEYKDNQLIYNNFLSGEKTTLTFEKNKMFIESNVEKPYLQYILYRLGNYYLI